MLKIDGEVVPAKIYAWVKGRQLLHGKVIYFSKLNGNAYCVHFKHGTKVRIYPKRFRGVVSEPWTM